MKSVVSMRYILLIWSKIQTNTIYNISICNSWTSRSEIRRSTVINRWTNSIHRDRKVYPFLNQLVIKAESTFSKTLPKWAEYISLIFEVFSLKYETITWFSELLKQNFWASKICGLDLLKNHALKLSRLNGTEVSSFWLVQLNSLLTRVLQSSLKLDLLFHKKVLKK